MNHLLAAAENLGQPLEGIGPLGLEGTTSAQGPAIFTKFISSAIGLMTIIAIIWFIFNFITGAIGIIASGGDKQALESAKKKLTTGIIGLVVVIAAVFIIDLIGTLLGIPDILNIQNLLNITAIGL